MWGDLDAVWQRRGGEYSPPELVPAVDEADSIEFNLIELSLANEDNGCWHDHDIVWWRKGYEGAYHWKTEAPNWGMSRVGATFDEAIDNMKGEILDMIEEYGTSLNMDASDDIRGMVILKNTVTGYYFTGYASTRSAWGSTNIDHAVKFEEAPDLTSVAFASMHSNIEVIHV